MGQNKFNTDISQIPQKAENGHSIEEGEGQIWLEFLRGSDIALGEIYRMNANRLFNYGRQFTKDENLVLDVIQDVFFELIKNRSKLGIAESVKSYLFASFRRRILRQIKRNQKVIFKANIYLEDGFGFQKNPLHIHQENLYSSDQKAMIEKFCNNLPANQREALMLYYMEEMSYEEVSKVMHLNKVKSARSMIYRALKSLNHMLSPIKNKILTL